MFSLFTCKAEGEPQRTSFYPLVHFPGGHNGRSWVSLKPRVSSFFQVTHVGAGVQGSGPSSSTLPGHSRKLDQKWSIQNWNKCPYDPNQCLRCRLCLQCHNKGLFNLSLLKVCLFIWKWNVKERKRKAQRDLHLLVFPIAIAPRVL